jgi:hypothetical protein
MSDPVLYHAAAAADAEKHYGIPASVLLALLSVEGGTNADGTPRAPDDGAGPASYGQFTYGTGKALAIKYGDSQSEVNGVARYLTQLGYNANPTRAIAAYNGGPGNPQYGYAQKVLARRSRYTNFDGAHNPVTQPAAPATSSSSKPSGLLSDKQSSGLARFGVGATLAIVAVAGMGVGVARATGAGDKLKELAA